MRAVNLVLPLLLLLGATARRAEESREKELPRDMFERALMQLIKHRRMFLDGFGNGTASAAMYRDFGFDSASSLGATGTSRVADQEGEEEGRGRRKKLRQMNRTLMAVVMAYTLKFIFLIPTFVGTLILLKFTTALAGFFYALFAAVLGLDHRREH